MAQKPSLKEAKQRAGRFCAFRERSPNELYEKLKSWGISEDESMRIVSELSKEGFVDEQRFANAFCNDKFEFNSWGKQKIRAGIFKHKLPEVIIQHALDRIDVEKYERRLKELAIKKWYKLENEELIKRKQKTTAYMVSKGFELDLIWNCIQQLEKERL